MNRTADFNGANQSPRSPIVTDHTFRTIGIGRMCSFRDDDGRRCNQHYEQHNYERPSDDQYR